MWQSLILNFEKFYIVVELMSRNVSCKEILNNFVIMTAIRQHFYSDDTDPWNFSVQQLKNDGTLDTCIFLIQTYCWSTTSLMKRFESPICEAERWIEFINQEFCRNFSNIFFVSFTPESSYILAGVSMTLKLITDPSN